MKTKKKKKEEEKENKRRALVLSRLSFIVKILDSFKLRSQSQQALPLHQAISHAF